jgi:hypothetical protein
MKSRILIAGGYGLVGSTIARHIRAISKDIKIILAGRNPENGMILAQELENARTTYLDLDDTRALNEFDWKQFDLIVSALTDPADTLIQAAMDHHIAHIGISKISDQVSPVLFAGLHSKPKRPIVLLGHWQAGTISAILQKAAEEFRHINKVELTALYDVRDPIGQMVVNELTNGESWINRGYIREKGNWKWVNAEKHIRFIYKENGNVMEGKPMASLDLPSIASITKASNIRFDLVQDESMGTIAGNKASHDVYIDLEGTLQSGEQIKQRTIVSDPNGQAHLTALGVLVSMERILGLDGDPPAPGGIHLPETLLSPEKAIARFKQFGVQILSDTKKA